MCTRFLYSVIPSELYWGEQTLKNLNGYLADNLNELFEQGVLVTCLVLP